MKPTLNNDDLLSNISYKKSLELIASQIISELLTEDDPPYEEKLDKKNKIYDNPGFGEVNIGAPSINHRIITLSFILNKTFMKMTPLF